MRTLVMILFSVLALLTASLATSEGTPTPLPSPEPPIYSWSISGTVRDALSQVLLSGIQITAYQGTSPSPSTMNYSTTDGGYTLTINSSDPTSQFRLVTYDTKGMYQRQEKAIDLSSAQPLEINFYLFPNGYTEPSPVPTRTPVTANATPTPAATPKPLLPAGSMKFPSNPVKRGESVWMKFLPAEAGPAKVDLYDIQGRHIQTVFDGTVPAGYYHLDWKVVNKAGRPLAPGTYIFVVKTGAAETKTKIVVAP